MFYKGFTRVLQGFYKGVTRVLQVVTGMFQGYFMGLELVKHGCYIVFVRVLQGCCNGSKRGCCKSVTWVLKGCYMGFSIVLQEFYKSVVTQVTCYMILVTFYLLPDTCNLLFTTRYLLPNTCYMLLVA